MLYDQEREYLLMEPIRLLSESLEDWEAVMVHVPGKRVPTCFVNTDSSV